MTLVMLMNWLLSFTEVVECNELASHAQESSFVCKLWHESFLSKNHRTVGFHVSSNQQGRHQQARPLLLQYWML